MSDETPELDIGALLAMTFEARPSGGMAERVGSRVALRATVGEFARLLLSSPWHWARGGEGSLVGEDEG